MKTPADGAPAQDVQKVQSQIVERVDCDDQPKLPNPVVIDRTIVIVPEE